MKSLNIFFVLLFAFTLFAQNSPKLEVVGGESINIGNKQRGTPVEYDIAVKNVGNADLKITSVSSSCGCTGILSSSDLIKPGESGSVKFSFNGQAMGQVSKNIYIVTNETENASHTVTFTVNMIDPVSLNPSSIMTEGKVGDELKQTATLTNSSGSEITIIEITSNSPVVKVLSDKMSIANGEAASLSIAIKLYEETTVNAAVMIKTNQGDFQIPILVDVKSK